MANSGFPIDDMIQRMDYIIYPIGNSPHPVPCRVYQERDIVYPQRDNLSPLGDKAYRQADEAWRMHFSITRLMESIAPMTGGVHRQTDGKARQPNSDRRHGDRKYAGTIARLRRCAVAPLRVLTVSGGL